MKLKNLLAIILLALTLPAWCASAPKVHCVSSKNIESATSMINKELEKYTNGEHAQLAISQDAPDFSTRVNTICVLISDPYH